MYKTNSECILCARACSFMCIIMYNVCTARSHEATLKELERVREELVEERAKRHLEVALLQPPAQQPPNENDPLFEALQCSEESVIDLFPLSLSLFLSLSLPPSLAPSLSLSPRHLTILRHYPLSPQYSELVDSVCQNEFLRRPEERRIPMSGSLEQRQAVMKDRKKVSRGDPISLLYIYHTPYTMFLSFQSKKWRRLH